MAQHSGFFNAIYNGGQYDRKYNANDYTDNLAVVISNGVLRSINDDLKVTASGMICTVAAGRAWINGHYYLNDAPYSFAAVTAPTGGARWDRIFLRLNKDVATRSVYLVYQQGTVSNNPAKPAPTRSGNTYDLVLADVYVGTNATSVVVTDTRSDTSVCGWLYSTSGDNSFFTSLDNSFNEWFEGVRDELSSVTLFKRYIWRTVLTQSARTVQFNIPQYDADTCFIEVYINGVLDHEGTGYTFNGTTRVLTFSGTLIAGTEVIVNCYKSIDGTGIESVSDEITELQNQYATIENAAVYNYDGTGLNDNLSLSQIAQAIYSGSYVAANVTPAAAAFLAKIGGNTYLSAIPADGQITINVIGRIHVGAAVAGNGSAANRYKHFAFGVDEIGQKRIVFDFAKCERIYVSPDANSHNIIFYGTDLDIRNANINVRQNGAGCVAEVFGGRYNTGRVNVENCRIQVAVTGGARIADYGTFVNCDVYCSSANDHSLAFCPTTDALIRLIGGTYRAYTASFQMVSAVMYTYGTETNAVIVAQNINCPTVAVQAFYQKNLCIAYAGKTYINGVITTLPSEGNYYEIAGAIAKNKPQ